jgi:hypothetical protein
VWLARQPRSLLKLVVACGAADVSSLGMLKSKSGKRCDRPAHMSLVLQVLPHTHWRHTLAHGRRSRRVSLTPVLPVWTDCRVAAWTNGCLCGMLGARNGNS